MRRRYPSIQTYLIAFGLALALSVLSLAAIVIDRYAASEQARLHQEASDLAKGLGRRVDREMAFLDAALRGLAHSASLQNRDWAAFHAQAAAIGRSPDLWITLRDRNGQQIVNTLKAPGEPLPRSGDPTADRQLPPPGGRLVSNLFTGAVSTVPSVTLSILVERRGEDPLVLTAALQSDAVAALLKERPLPPGWTAGVVDGAGRVIARTANHAEFVGKPATQDYFRHATGESGAWIGRNLVGVPALAAYSRSPETGWSIVASVPEAVVMAPLHDRLRTIAVSGALLVALALGLGAWLGRRIAAPIRGLAQAGIALGQGKSPAAVPSPYREAADASDALLRAGVLLRERDAELRQAEERSRTLAEAMPALVWLSREDGTTVRANSRVEAYAGGPVPDLAAWGRLVHPDDMERAGAVRREALEGRAEGQVELRLRRADGVFRWHSVQINPVRIVGDGAEPFWLTTALDIEELKRAQSLQENLNAVLERRVAEATQQLRGETTVRRKAEDQLLRTQKMEAISRLTGGIAHDFNNKLMVISANIDAVIKQTKKQPQVTRKLLSALVAADRAAALMSKLLAFARRQDVRAQYIDVGERLASIAELLGRSLLTDSVAVELLVDDEVWALDVDPHQLETAVLNLAVNARDAMPEGGTITVEAGNTRVWANEVPGLAPGEYVVISVHDTGVGIPADRLDRVVEPFFTTKPATDGTGLGLSQVYGFARQLGGSVVIDSTEGEGTSVSMYLPKAALPARVGGGPVDDVGDVLPDAGRQARILVVDDDVDVATAVEAMLTAGGYSVEVAFSPDEALDILKGSKPDIVLTDVTMPGSMDGLALGRRIRELLPDMPVVLLSGNPTSVATQTEFPLIVKPVTSQRIDAEIRRQLGADDESKVVRFVPGAKRPRA